MNFEPITITPIGLLRCKLKNKQTIPKNYSESDQKGVIEILPKYTAGLDGIEPGQTITVVFWFDRSRRDLLEVHPRGDKSRTKRGVFATRSPDRPNPIAISELRVISKHDNQLEVMHIDALDNTPVLDIKTTIRGK